MIDAKSRRHLFRPLRLWLSLEKGREQPYDQVGSESPDCILQKPMSEKGDLLG